jgi:hypothetical protein
MLARPLLLLVLAVSSAAGDPPAKPAPPVVTILPEANDAWSPQGNVKLFHPGIGGGTSTGIVIDPGDHPDARPYPQGMVIRPPDIDARMLLDLDDHTSIAGKLYNSVRNSLGTLLQLVNPSTI